MIYYVIYLILILSTVFEAFGSKNISVLGTKGVNTKRAMKYSLSSGCFFVIAMYLSFIVVFHYETIGIDTPTYHRMFKMPDILSSTAERGYCYVNIFFRNILDSFYLMQVVLMTFCCYGFYMAFHKYALLPCFAIFAHIFSQGIFFILQLGDLRQWIATCVIIWGYKFINEKSLVKWTLVVILAMQMHISAILVFPMYFTSRIIVKPWFAFFMLVFSIWMMLFGQRLIYFMLQIATMLSFLPQRGMVLIYRYMDNKKNEFNSGLGYLLHTAINAYMIFLYKFSSKETRSKSYLFNFLLGVILGTLGFNMEGLQRIAWYYYTCGLGAAAYGLLAKQNRFFKKTRWFQIIIMCCIIAFHLLSFYRSMYTPSKKRGFPEINFYYPYETFLFK